MDLGNKMFGAMAWSGIERLLLQAIQFLLGIILARILSPNEYGTMAILMVFIVLSQVFIDSGFTKALTQKINRNENDKSTVLIFNVFISLLCYLLIWFTSPFIADFYEIPELISYFKVIGLSLIINALYTVPNTLFTIKLDFKSITVINFVSVIFSGILAIYLAYHGFGVWSLVYQVLVRSTLTCLLTWFLLKWIPNFKFSKESFIELFQYGSKLLASSLLAQLFSNLNSLLIGKYIGAKDLGYYSRGTQFSDALYNTFSPAINGVLLPGLAPLQNNREVLIRHTRRIIKTTTLITLPFFLILTVLAEPIILVLLTDKWAPAIPIMQIFSIARLITVVGGVNINLLYIIGRTDLVLRQQYVCIVIRVGLVLMAIPYGVVMVAIAELVSSFIHFFINAYFPGKLMGYGGISQLKDVFKIVICGLIMAIPLFFISNLFENLLIGLMVSTTTSFILYVATVKFLKIEELAFIINKAKQFLVKK